MSDSHLAQSSERAGSAVLGGFAHIVVAQRAREDAHDVGRFIERGSGSSKAFLLIEGSKNDGDHGTA
jgi:hypothetical protein